MKKITLQDIFSAAWQAFVVEKKPPAMEFRGERFKCRYITNGGRRCAVGLCIPDGHIGMQNDGPVSMLIEDHPDLFDIQSRVEADKLQALLHDSLCDEVTGEWAFSHKEIEGSYYHAAAEFNLTVPEVVA